MRYYVIAGLSALLLSLLAGYVSLPVLRKLRVGQTINELGPQSHLSKQGTLTMGGVGVILSGVIAGVAFGFYHKNTNGLLVLFCALSTLAFGCVGFIDDYLKVVKHRSMGLSVKQKFALQIIAALALSCAAYFIKPIDTRFALPFTSVKLNIGVLYIPVMTFIMVATDNSANILDGLDGLLSGNSTIALATVSAYAFIEGSKTGNGSLMNVGIFMLCMSMAVFGFLKYNTHPATVILGDVGSLGIGGALAGCAAVTGSSLLLPFCCVTMVISSLSDILQLWYMKRHKGRKLFRMSPYHHHLELGGMPETRVVNLYNIITVIGCAAALILFA